MGKKRKGGGAPYGGDTANKRRRSDDENKLIINTYEDVADSEDEFHSNRDKILLSENPFQRARRRIQEDERFLEPSDEEVLPEDELSASESDLDEDASEMSTSPIDVSDRYAGQDQKDEGSQTSEAAQEDEDLSGWGTSRKDYYDADPIQTEADALAEEQEARRLQQKSLQGMTEADFGLDEIDWAADGLESGDASVSKDKGFVQEVLPKLEITKDMSPGERNEILKSRYPEFAPLAKEFLDLQSVHGDLLSSVRDKENRESQGKANGNLESNTTGSTIKYRALSAYLTALSMYFALLSSGAASLDGKGQPMSPDELREHSVMATLLDCRNMWDRVRNFKFHDRSVVPHNSAERLEPGEHVPGPTPQEEGQSTNEKASKSFKRRLSKAEKAQLKFQAEAEATKREKIRETEESLADLATLASSRKNGISKTTPLQVPGAHDSSGDSDLGDPAGLTAHEAAEKARRKKSLRFYTAQIAQKSKKRDEAGRGAGGDTDIPYKERLKDHQQRLNDEAERRGKKGRSDPDGKAFDGEPEDSGEEISNSQRRAMKRSAKGDPNQGADPSEDDDYYDLVSRQSASKKAAKTARAAAFDAAAQNQAADGGAGDDSLGGDGKRGITYAIAKNKGLHAHRKKEVRNPRVKKRKRFEDKKKKLKSVRQVYKGEREGRGGYGGEKTGISRNVVKSVKL